MKRLGLVPPLLALAGLLAGGCLVTSAQVLAHFGLPDPLTVAGPAAVVGVDVDLSTVPEYEDHKDELKDLVDLALLGRFRNVGPATALEVWMTPGFTSHTQASQVTGDPSAVRVWGPFALPAGPSTTAISWTQAAALFGAGKGALVGQIKGDGQFTLYVLGNTGAYDFVVDHGALAMVLDAGD
jgi:hypothetical protein